LLAASEEKSQVVRVVQYNAILMAKDL
jgi:hypothetical protein